MSFWTGFGTGLAKSVDQGLQKAMSKRDDELSRAKTFWQTRQAQKLDQKDSYDARAEKALKRMISEAGDDATLGLAAFNAAGGDPDSVEALIKRIDATRASKGTYSILDSLKTADGEPIKAGENAVGLDAALKSVRMQLKGVDASNIKIDDPLSKFGLGLKGGASQAAADSVNSMIPPETVEKITGIPKATLDMSNMLEAEKYAQDQKLIAKQLTPTLAESNASIVQELMSLDPSAEDFAGQSAKLIAKQKQVLTAIGAEAKAKDTSTTGSLTTSTLNTMYQQQLTANLVAKGINTKEGSYADGAGNMIYGDGPGYLKALNNASNAFNTTFVGTLQQEDGSFGPAASTLISTNNNLKSIVDKSSGKSTDKTAASKLDDTSTKPLFDSLESIAKNKEGFAADIFSKLPDVNNKKHLQNLFNKLIDSGASKDEANKIIVDAQSNAIKNNKANVDKYTGFIMPGTDVSVDVTVDDKGSKTAGKYNWNPNYAPSMPRLLSDKSVPNNIRNAVLQDYIKLQSSKGRNLSLEDAKAKFGIE